MFSRNADINEGKGMSRVVFMKVVNNIVGQSIWKTSNIADKRLSIDEVLDYTAELYSITKEELISGKRKREFIEPRMFASQYLRKAGFTFESIGDKMGSRHHASILHHIKTMKGLLEVDKEVSKRYCDAEFFLNSKRIKPI